MTTTRTTAKTHPFTLILGGLADVTDETEDALYEAGCDDALLGSRDGVPYLDFDRAAASLVEAILSAMDDIRRADVGTWVVRIEPDDFVTAAEIARRTRRSRESVRQLVRGERGPGGFPAPVSSVKRRSPIWRWAEVANWFVEHHDGAVDEARRERASVIAALNSLLELRRHVPEPRLVSRLWRLLGRAKPRTAPRWLRSLRRRK